jgi:Holliday junction resolvase RusA-like endonuclease
MTDTVRFTIPGRVAGKGRPRITTIGGHPHAYTPIATLAAETRVRDAWTAAGEPWLGDVPLEAHITMWEARPRAHWTTSGYLSAAGRRMPYPARKPDLDNCAKLVFDALNGCLYVDDRQVVELVIARRWTVTPDAPSCADVTVRTLV